MGYAIAQDKQARSAMDLLRRKAEMLRFAPV
jgi:hypothetical protein